ncbi:MAG: hypothetical protein U0136_12970 [Bdellovibrionota bacterium]
MESDPSRGAALHVLLIHLNDDDLSSERVAELRRDYFPDAELSVLFGREPRETLLNPPAHRQFNFRDLLHHARVIREVQHLRKKAQAILDHAVHSAGLEGEERLLRHFEWQIFQDLKTKVGLPLIVCSFVLSSDVDEVMIISGKRPLLQSNVVAALLQANGVRTSVDGERALVELPNAQATAQVGSESIPTVSLPGKSGVPRILIAGVTTRTSLEMILAELADLDAPAQICTALFADLNRTYAVQRSIVTNNPQLSVLDFPRLSGGPVRDLVAPLSEGIGNAFGEPLKRVLLPLLGISSLGEKLSIAGRMEHELRELVRKLQPALLITGGDQEPQQQTVYAVAAAEKIPLVLLPSFFDLMSDWQLMQYRYPADAILLAPSPYLSKAYAQAGHPTELIMDVQLKKYAPGSRREVSLETSAREKYVVFTSQSFFQQSVLILAIAKAMRQLPDWQFIVRPHPLERDQLTVSELPDDLRIDAVTPLDQLLQGADAVLTETSTTAYDAVLADSPIIILNFDNRYYDYNFVREGVALEVSKESDLVPALYQVLGDTTTQAALSEARLRYRTKFGASPGATSVAERLKPLLRR